MRLKLLEKFKSIEPSFEWSVPEFGVVSGVNGVGKTHLLELLHDGLQDWPLNFGRSGPRSVTEVEPHKLQPGEVIFSNGEWKLANSSSSADKLHNLSIQTVNNLNLLQSDAKSAKNEQQLYKYRSAAAVARYYQERGEAAPTTHEDVNRLPPGYALSSRLDIPYLSQDIASVLNAHQWKIQHQCWENQVASQFREVAEVEAQFGKAPWDILNDYLKRAELDLEVVRPHGHYLKQYHFMLRAKSNQTDLHPNNLSSGEKVILGVAMWILATSRYRVSAKVALLDEPDAHLHPSLIPAFLRALISTFVEECEIRVVLTSHRTETVLLAPRGTLWQMSRDGQRLRSIKEHLHTVHALTNGYVAALGPSKCVLCEDVSDVEFLNAVQSVYYRIGDIDGSLPRLDFQSISTRTKNDDDSGGRSKVEAFMQKLDSTDLADVIRGVVDNDNSPSNVRGVHQLNRYCIENYLIDPIYLYLSLLEAGIPPTLPSDVGIHKDETHKIRDIDTPALQIIVDAVIDMLTGLLSPEKSASTRESIEYSNGITLQLPTWLRTVSGKSLIRTVRGNYPNDGTRKAALRALSPHMLRDAMIRSRILPVDLQRLMTEMRSPLDIPEEPPVG